MVVTSFLLAIGLAFVHLLGEKLKFLDKIPRSAFLSFSGGLAIAYVFVHLLPELVDHQERLSEAWEVSGISHHAYLLAMIGLLTFYGLERMVKKSVKENERTSPNIFWIHIISFMAYNVLIGYLLIQRANRAIELILYFVAIGLHFIANDYSLRKDHQERYRDVGRWLLFSAVLLGWLLSVWIEVPEVILASLFAFLSGGIVLNVLKEELPEERESRLIPFIAGALFYSIIMMVLQ